MRVPAFAVIVLCVTALPAAAQPFSSARSSVAGYIAATITPQKACESLSSFKAEGVTTIQARVVAATADTPQHCRVTGVITPEVAFEVNLPERWNQRFYMTGNGGLAGDPVDTPTNADRTGGLNHGFVTARTTPAMTRERSRAGRSSSAIRKRRSITPTAPCT